MRSTPVALRHVVRSELLKARSLRSTVISLVVAAVLVVVMGPVMAVGAMVGEATAGGIADAGDPLGAAVSGVSSALYAVLAFGVLAVTGEFATGTIRSTLTATPRRRLLVAGKAVAVAALTFASMLVATVAAFVATRVVLATAGIDVPVDARSVRVVVGGALYLTVVALMGSAFGWLLRSTAGAVAAAVGLLVVVPAMAYFLPAPAAQLVRPYLPDTAGMAVYTPVPEVIGPWTGFAVFTAYAAVLLLAAGAAAGRRDA